MGDTLDIKVMVVGDSNVGKTCLLISYTSNSFPGDYVPTVFDNYTANMSLGGKNVTLGLWDTAGSAEYDSLRPLSYPGTDIFLVCFSLVEPETFDTIKAKWVPEINANFGGDSKPKIVIVGTKVDLRNKESTAESLKAQGKHPISKAEGEQLAASVGAIKYLECSALTQEGLNDVFRAVVEIIIPDVNGKSVPNVVGDGKGKKDKKKKDKNDKDCLLQ